MYSDSPSFSRTDWKSNVKHVAIMAFPCCQDLIPAATALFSDSMDFIRCIIEVGMSFMSLLSSELAARSEADNASMAWSKKSNYCHQSMLRRRAKMTYIACHTRNIMGPLPIVVNWVMRISRTDEVLEESEILHCEHW
jgi:hypothetical protein